MENILGKELLKRTGAQNNIQPVRLFNLFCMFTLAKLQKSEGSLYLNNSQPHIHRHTHNSEISLGIYEAVLIWPMCCRVGCGDSMQLGPAWIQRQSSQDGSKKFCFHFSLSLHRDSYCSFLYPRNLQLQPTYWCLGRNI